MVENTRLKDKVKSEVTHVQPGMIAIRAAQKVFKHDRKPGLAELNKLFRSGILPEPALDGRYAGELVALDITPGLIQIFEWLINRWMPWLGKTFNAAQQSGDNIFTQDSYILARFFNPLYRGFVKDEAAIYRCFRFHTYVAPGLADHDREVLKIDYDLDGNPFPTIRRILDELVQLDSNLYLGKAHVHWWWDGWQTVAYFLLSKSVN